MWCDKQFVAFNAKLKLDPTRQGRIDSAVSKFSAFCHGDAGQLAVAMSESPFLQGSVSMKTAIKPLTGDEFDVDLVYPFALGVFKPEAQRPLPIFNWFVSRLQQDAFYKENLTRKDRCVRINYAGDFHVDIIPSTPDVVAHPPYAVPARDLSDWITNDPKGFVGWVAKKDAASGMPDLDNVGVFVRSVRYMKRWRDHTFGEASAVSSILLTTVLGNHEASVQTYSPPLTDPLYPTYRHDAAYLFDLLRLTWSCLERPSPKAFMHPTIPGEDLARGWDDNYLTLFRNRLQTCIERLGKGISADNIGDAVRHFKEALGPSFPEA
jgi:hypothetical protein